MTKSKIIGEFAKAEKDVQKSIDEIIAKRGIDTAEDQEMFLIYLSARIFCVASDGKDNKKCIDLFNDMVHSTIEGIKMRKKAVDA